MAGWTGKKANVVFSKPEEPSFLKKFKEKAGYKEDSGVEDKFQVMPKATDEDLEDGDDELPQVVQLNPGDISQEEFNAIVEKDKEVPKENKEEDISEGGRILFRQLVRKRSQDDKNELKASTKKAKNNIPEKKEKKTSTKGEKSNKKLLSFNDEDEDEDEDGST